MKKTYKLRNLGCANCAAKMENRIKKLDGVEDAKVNFMASKLTIEADESCMDEILSSASSIIRKIEPDCKILMEAAVK